MRPRAGCRSGCARKAPGLLLRASNMPMQLAAIRAGAGRGVLPCFIGDPDPLLDRLTPPIPEIAAEYWIIVHRDLRRAACVRAVMDWIRRLFNAEHRDLAGVERRSTGPLPEAARKADQAAAE